MNQSRKIFFTPPLKKCTFSRVKMPENSSLHPACLSILRTILFFLVSLWVFPPDTVISQEAEVNCPTSLEFDQSSGTITCQAQDLKEPDDVIIEVRNATIPGSQIKILPTPQTYQPVVLNEFHYGIQGQFALGDGTGEGGDIIIRLNDVTISDVSVFAIGASHSRKGDISISSTMGTYETTTDNSNGISAQHHNTGDISISSSDTKIITRGDNSRGIIARHNGDGNINLSFSETGISTEGERGYGIYGFHTGSGDIDIQTNGGNISTEGERGYGIYGLHYKRDGSNSGNLRISTNGGSIETIEDTAYGILGFHSGDGDIDIQTNGGTIKTSGTNSYGIYGLHQGDTGDIRITSVKSSIETNGDRTHGIVVYQSGTGSSYAEVEHINVQGADAHGLRFGRIKSGTTDEIERAAPLDVNGYRKQIAHISGRVMGGTGSGAGVYMAGGGRVTIGPQGFLGAQSGVAILAEGNNGNNSPRKLHVNLEEFNGRPWERLGGRIVNEGSGIEAETILAVNGVNVFHNSPMDVWAPSGLHVARLNPDNDFEGLPDFSSQDAWLSDFHPRAGVYEALPGAIRRIHTVPCRFSSNRRATVDICGGRGEYTPERSGTGMKYTYDQRSFQAHLKMPLSDEITGWLGGRLVNGEADVTTTLGHGQLKVRGPGLYGGLHIERDNNHYGEARLSWSRYDAEMSARLSSDGDAEQVAAITEGKAYSLELEAGRHFVLKNGMQLTGRGWYSIAGASVDPFLDDNPIPDSEDTMVSAEDRQSKVGLGLNLVRTRELVRDDSYLVLRGGLGLERVIKDDNMASAGGVTLGSAARENRVLVDVGGDWHRGDNVIVSGEVFAHGLVADDTVFGLKVGMNWSF